MNRQELAKKYLTEKQYEIWYRTQEKKKNEFPKIAKDLWVSKQAVYKEYVSIKTKLDRLFDKLKENDAL